MYNKKQKPNALMILNKLFRVEISILALSLLFINRTYANTEFTSQEAISYLGKTYEQAKDAMLKKGYSFFEKYDNMYTFKKTKNGIIYESTVAIKSSRVNALGTNEIYTDYPSILKDIRANGFVFVQGGLVSYPTGKTTEFSDAPINALPSSIIRFYKQLDYSCSIIGPFNLKNGNDLISVNYGFHTPDKSKTIGIKNKTTFDIPLTKKTFVGNSEYFVLHDKNLVSITLRSPSVLWRQPGTRTSIDESIWVLELTTKSFQMWNSTQKKVYKVLRNAGYSKDFGMQKFELADASGGHSHNLLIDFRESDNRYSVIVQSIDYKEEYQFQNQVVLVDKSTSSQ